MNWLTSLAGVMVLAGCAVGASAPGTQPPSLRVAAWNIEHLAERDGQGCRPRTDEDYAEVRRYIDRLDADVIAFQEVQSAAAARDFQFSMRSRECSSTRQSSFDSSKARSAMRWR